MSTAPVLDGPSGATRPWASFLERLLEVADRHGDAPAVVDASGRRSHGQLQLDARRVAGHLAGAGVGRGSVVGLQTGRSADAVVAMIGVLMTGAAWTPLDPSHPAERRRRMVEAAGCAVVVTAGPEGALADGPSQDGPSRDRSFGGAVVVPLARALRGVPLEVVAAPAPEDPAYVLFTSGSTGVPKGVVVPHRGVTALLEWASAELTDADAAHAATSLSFSFDPSVLEVFAPLLRGGCVRVLTGALDPALRTSPVTFTATTPSVLLELLRGHRLPTTTSTVVVGGETLPQTTTAAFFAAHPTARLLHAYGPTEASVAATVQVLRSADEEVHLGHPLPEVEVVLVDDAGREVDGPGAVGELHLGGAHLALGYLGGPELTAERFVTRTRPSGAVQRLYRTGDAARRRPDGALDFLGRLDRQVKVRGHRVELQEVERVLLGDPSLAEVCVLVDGEGAGARLLACVTAGAGSVADPAAVRARARQELPEYMVPGVVEVVTSMPLTPSGKIDGPELLRRTRAAAASAARAAGGEGRGWVAELVARVLRLPELPADDEHLVEDLGATSLQLMEVRSRLAEATGSLDDPGVLVALVDPTVADLARTVAGLAPPPSVPPSTLVPPSPLVPPPSLVPPSPPTSPSAVRLGAGRRRGARLSAIDRSWATSSDVVVIGPLVLPPLEQLRAAAVVLAAAVPEAHVGERLDLARGRWSGPRLTPEELGRDAVVALDGGGPQEVGFGEFCRRVHALRPAAVPVRWVVAGDHLALAVSHAVGDAALGNRLLAGLPHLAATGQLPPDAGAASAPLRHPLVRALVHHYAGHPERVVVTARALLAGAAVPRSRGPHPTAAPTAGREAASTPLPTPAAPTAPVSTPASAAQAGAGRAGSSAPGLTALQAVMTDDAAADLRAWRSEHAATASPLAVLTHLVHRALVAEGLRPRPTLLALFDARAYLPRGSVVTGNFSVGLDLRVDASWSTGAVDAALREALTSGRPLTALVAGALRQTLPGRRGAPPEAVPGVATDGRGPLLTMSLMGRHHDVEALAWRPGERVFSAMTVPAPGGITVTGTMLHRHRQLSFSFDPASSDRAALQRALDAVTRSPVQLLDGGSAGAR